MQAKTAAFLSTFLLIAIAYVPAQEEVGKSPANDRFDMLVRESFFAGIAGDEAAFDPADGRCGHRFADGPNSHSTRCGSTFRWAKDSRSGNPRAYSDEGRERF